VIAARKGILPELIRDGETGILIEDKPADLARAMITMIKEKNFRLRCSRMARQYAETILSPERYLQKVIGCYESLVSEDRGQRTEVRGQMSRLRRRTRPRPSSSI
jgi:glycosyltransferase involved in cell wall biosynthesis